MPPGKQSSISFKKSFKKRKNQILPGIGATGAQGVSVTKALLKENKFAVRTLIRDRNSAKSIQLAGVGAEFLGRIPDDIEILKHASKSCYGVFGVTSFRGILKKNTSTEKI